MTLRHVRAADVKPGDRLKGTDTYQHEPISVTRVTSLVGRPRQVEIVGYRDREETRVIAYTSLLVEVVREEPKRD